MLGTAPTILGTAPNMPVTTLVVAGAASTRPARRCPAFTEGGPCGRSAVLRLLMWQGRTPHWKDTSAALPGMLPLPCRVQARSRLGTTPNMLGTTPNMLATTPNMLGTTPSMLGTTPSMLGTTLAVRTAAVLGATPTMLGPPPPFLPCAISPVT